MATVVVTSGNDSIEGFDHGGETLSGGLGADTLRGYSGSDTYLYAAGDGADRIEEAGARANIDRLRLIGIRASDVNLSRSGSDAVLRFTMGGSVTLVNQLSSDGFHGVEEIIFADDTIVRSAQLVQAMSQFGSSTSGVPLLSVVSPTQHTSNSSIAPSSG